MDRRYVSSIPKNISERTISDYQQERCIIRYRRVECLVEGEVVGQRYYDGDGRLIIETPLKNGKKHGVEYCWYDTGELECAEPYCEGKLHGTAKQWSEDGRLMGTYHLVHGTGLDIWRNFRDNGTIYISEIHSICDGLPHGFEWWLNEDESSVFHELHWYKGKLHGIERMWNDRERLCRGYPKYWIHNEQVKKRKYISHTKKDSTLPPYRQEDQIPARQFRKGDRTFN